MTDANASVQTRAIATVEYRMDEKKRKYLYALIHRWEARENRDGGLVYIEGSEGSYAVNVLTIPRDANEKPQLFERWRGGFEHAFMRAFKVKGEYEKKGCADE